MTKPEAAVATFKQGFNCSQAVLSAYAEPLCLERTTALRLAAGFGGGLGRLGETCGAVTGALMVLGLKHGSPGADDQSPQERMAERERVYQGVQAFITRFQARHGSVVCRELLGCDIRTPAGYEQAKERQLFLTRCPKFVQSAAEILEDLP